MEQEMFFVTPVVQDICLRVYALCYTSSFLYEHIEMSPVLETFGYLSVSLTLGDGDTHSLDLAFVRQPPSWIKYPEYTFDIVQHSRLYEDRPIWVLTSSRKRYVISHRCYQLRGIRRTYCCPPVIRSATDVSNRLCRFLNFIVRTLKKWACTLPIHFLKESAVSIMFGWESIDVPDHWG